MAVLSYMERNNILVREQHGFMENISCLMNLIVGQNWAVLKDINTSVDVIWIDQSKASVKSLTRALD